VLISSNASVTFAQTPQINVTVLNGFPGSNSCGLYIYANIGNAPYQWTQVPGTVVNVSGSTVTIPAQALPPGTAANIVPGKTTMAFVGC
jgi:hypothetical protein